MISVVMPVLNEALALPRTLAVLLGQEGAYEVIAVDGGSTDATPRILAGEPRVRLLTAPRGRGSQMNAGARAACGQWLLFLHADTLLPVGALAVLNALEADPSWQAGGFRHRFSGRGLGLRLISRLNNLRCRVTGVVYGDQAFFVRRALFEELGGFPEVPMEDVLLGERLRVVARPRLLPATVVTDSRKFERMGVWRSLARVLALQATHALGLPPLGRRFFEDVR